MTIHFREILLPMDIKGFTAIDPNGDYNVYINSSLCDEKKKLTLQHEIAHINSGHFESELPAFVLEEQVKYG